MIEPLLLAVDQGTTSTRSILYDARLPVVAIAQKEYPQHYPAPGWVEHDPEDIWQSTLSTMRSAIANAGAEPSCIAAIGIANQRETTLLWDHFNL